MKKHKVSKKGSNRLFKSTANRTHVRNVAPPPQRGGIRL